MLAVIVGIVVDLITIFDNLEQLLNTLLPILVTFSGISTSVNTVQYENAYLPILVNVDGNFTVFNDLQ